MRFAGGQSAAGVAGPCPCVSRLTVPNLPQSGNGTSGVLTVASQFLHQERLGADAVLQQMFGLSRFVAPTTFARFFQGFTGQAREDAWASPGSWTLKLLPPRPKGALQGYNPRKRGGVTGHPVLAFSRCTPWTASSTLTRANSK